MALTLQDLLGDPRLYLYEFDENDAIFLQMTRDHFARSTFLDGRIKQSNRPAIRVPLDQLLQAFEDHAAPVRRIGWIFHVAQCGSTLIARALDRPGQTLVLREPAALRRLGVVAGGGATCELPERARRLLDLVLQSLGKPWEPGQAVILKANVPVNFIAERIMRRDPEAPAVLLHFPLANYAAAILRTDGHVQWTERVFAELRIAENAACTGAEPRSAAEKAAALWFVQMQAFDGLLGAFPHVRSLDAQQLFGRPAETINAAARLFGLALAEGEASAIASGALFHSYSKNPAVDYDPEVRLAREAAAMRRLGPELAQARSWVEAARQRMVLAQALDKPLLGDPVPLLG